MYLLGIHLCICPRKTLSKQRVNHILLRAVKEDHMQTVLCRNSVIHTKIILFVVGYLRILSSLSVQQFCSGLDFVFDACL